MKTEKICSSVTVFAIMVMSCACTLCEKKPFVDSTTTGVPYCDPCVKCSNVLLVRVGSLEFDNVEFLSAVQRFKQHLVENNIYLSIVIDPKNIDLENTMINFKMKNGELRRVLDQFCGAWGGRWELLSEVGPIKFEGGIGPGPENKK